MNLSNQQLADAAIEALKLGNELFIYYSWKAHVEPKIRDVECPLYVHLVQQGVVVAQLIAYRKLNDLFVPRKKGYDDDLKISLFGLESSGGFLTPEECQEIHKRAAHPTTRRAVIGDLEFELYRLTHRALLHSIPFYVHLGKSPLAQEFQEVAGIKSVVDIWRQMWDAWSSIVPEAERLSAWVEPLRPANGG